jgi:hypothetical protein
VIILSTRIVTGYPYSFSVFIEKTYLVLAGFALVRFVAVFNEDGIKWNLSYYFGLNLS